MALFAELGDNLGVKSALDKAVMFNALQNAGGRSSGNDAIQFYARGGVLGNGFRGNVRGRGGAVIVAPSQTQNTYHFHGDLEFPNVRDGSDVEAFLRNLEAMMGEG
jgi:hypothetical protein